MAKEQRLLIEKEPIKKFIEDGLNNPDKRAAFGYDAIEILAEIEFAPTVDAEEVVHGEWLDGSAVHNGKEVYQSIDCSACEEVFKIESHDREYWKKRFERCFCCGAVMDGGRTNG